MSFQKNSGCGLWVLLVVIVSAFFGFSSNQITTISPTATLIPTVVPTFVATLYPQETNAYFVVENNQISYSYRHTLGIPCYYYIAGRVLDLNGEPFTDFVINIKMVEIEDVIIEEGYAFPGSNGYAGDGPSQWGMVLPASQVQYEIWLSTELGGEELSQHIVVPPRDCDQNAARVNFVQVRPLP